MTPTKRTVSIFTGLLFAVLACSCSQQDKQATKPPPAPLPEITPSWFVGDVEAGEWLAFKKVYLTEGTYRFTAHLGNAAEAGSVQLSLSKKGSGQPARVELPATTVPATGAEDRFTLVHLGAEELQTGEYDVSLSFRSPGLSGDFIHIRKSDAKGKQVLADDMHAPPPVHQGTSITPIGPSQATNGGWTYGKYSMEQSIAWYKQPVYLDLNHEDAYHVAIEEAIASRLNWCWLHGRLSMWKPQWDHGVDREVVANPGRLPSQRLKRFFEILDRNPMADHLRYSYFCDNIHFGGFYKKKNKGEEPRWDSPDFQEQIWTHWLRPWYENVPRNRHKLVDGDKVFFYIWTADCGVKGLKNSYPFFDDFRKRLRAEFDLGVHFLLPKRFLEQDPRLEALNYAHPPWFYWSHEENVRFSTFKDRTLGFATNGRRLPVASVWDLDWDPKTGTGTRKHESKNPPDGHLRLVRQTKESKTDYELGILEARKRGAEWLLLESWGNVFENSLWCRSEHPQFAFPGESIAITRKYSDEATSSIMLQLESFDACSDNSPGNAGGTYRYNWHGGEEVAADIFRPKRQIGSWQEWPDKTAPTRLSAGSHDIWTVSSSGKLRACEIDGNEPWKPVANQVKLQQLALGKYIAWGIDAEGMAHGTSLPEGWSYKNCGKWSPVNHTQPFRDLAVNPRGRLPFFITVEGELWGWQGTAWEGAPKQFKQSPKLIDIAVGDRFLWGILKQGGLAFTTVDLDQPWRQCEAGEEAKKIEAGNNELWVLMENGRLYRTLEGGGNYLEFVAAGVKDFTVGVGHVWRVGIDDKLSVARLDGFVHGSRADSLPLMEKR